MLGALVTLVAVLLGGPAPRPPAPPPVPEPVVAPPAEIPSPAPQTPPGPRNPSQKVISTAYCLTGRMASGERAYVGAVASNRHPLGTRLWLEDSPWGPGEFVVADRIGWGTQLDFAMPRDCGGARRWGKRMVLIVE